MTTPPPGAPADIQQTGIHKAGIQKTPAPPTRSSTLHRRARAAAARSVATDRVLAALVGVTLLALGVLVTLLSNGVFGAARASRPLLDPIVVDVLAASPLAARLIPIGAGLLLAVLGIVWTARSLRPERRPDLVLDGGADTAIVVSSTAAADAVTGQVATLPGVRRARTRLVGSEAAPALRLTLWLADDADVRQVLDRLDREVLAAARDSLGLTTLPAAVRLELDSAPPASRVS